MKKGNSRDREMPRSWQFVRPPNDSRNLSLPRDPSLGRGAGVGAKKIFVVKQTRWLAPTQAAAPKRVQQILIFDNHPDSLRLVSGHRGADSGFHVSDPPRTTSWGVALLWILVVGLMMAMFWPLY
jgi:hypothetical protein